MPGQADGSIIIDTELNSDGFKAGSNELLAAIRSLANEVKNLRSLLEGAFERPMTVKINTGSATRGASDLQKQIDSVSTSVDKLEPTFQRAMSGSESAMSSFDSKATELEGKIAGLQEQMNAVAQTKYPTAEYQSICAEADKAKQKFDALLDRQEKMQALGVDQNSNQWKSLQYDMEMVSNKYHELIAKKEEFERSGTAYTLGSETAQYSQMEATLSSARSRLEEMRAAAAGVTSEASGMTGAVNETAEGARRAEAHTSRLATAARRVAGYIGSAARNAAGALVSGIKSAASHMSRLLFHSRGTKNQFSGLISSAKKFTLSLLGARGIYALLRKAVSAYMSENEELSNKLKSCWSGIGNILGPIITKLINLVAQAVAYVTSFLKLFGVISSSASKALNNASGTASSAAKELKRQLASFDELNILSDDKSDGSGGGGSDSGTAALPDVTLPDWAKMLVEQIKSGDWAGAATTLADKLNSMISGVDWAGLGEKFGKKIDGLLTFITTFIDKFDWKNVGSKLAEFLNNLIKNVDWSKLGKLLTSKLRIAFEFLTGFFETFDGAAFGKGLYDFLMGAIEGTDWVKLTGNLFKAISNFIQSIDFGKLGEALSKGFRTILQSLNAAITNFDWAGLGRKIADFINSIDWGGIIKDLIVLISNVLNSAVDLIFGFVTELNWSDLGTQIGDALNTAFKNINWSKIGETVNALIKGILDFAINFLAEFDIGQVLQDLLDGIGDIIKNLDLVYILKGIVSLLANLLAQIPGILVSALGGIVNIIGSLFESLGIDCIADFMYGIEDGLTDAREWLTENLREPIANAMNDFMGHNSSSGGSSESSSESSSGRHSFGRKRNVESEEEMLERIKEKYKDITDAINNYTAAWNSSMQNIQKNAVTQTAELDNLRKLKDELGAYVDENGRLLNEGYKPRVNFVLNQLNSAFGTEYSLIDGQIGQYQELQKEIDNLIEKQRIQIILTAEKEAYATAIQNQTAYLAKLNEAQAAFDAISSRMENSRIISTAMQADYDAAKENLDNAQKLVDETTRAIVTYETDAALALSDNAEDRKRILDRIGKAYVDNGETVELSLKNQLDNETAYLESLKKLRADGNADITDEMIKQQEARVESIKKEYEESEAAVKSGEQDIADAVKSGGDDIIHLNLITEDEVLNDVENSGKAVAGSIKTNAKYAAAHFNTEIKRMPVDTEEQMQLAAKKMDSNTLKTTAKNTSNSILSAYKSNIAKIASEMQDMVSKTSNVLASNKTVPAAASNLGTNVKNAFTSQCDLSYATNNAINGVVNGIYNGTSSAVYAMQSMASNLVHSFKNTLQIASPSKVFTALSKFIPAGVADGVEANSKEAVGAMSDMASAMQSEIKAGDYSIGKVKIGEGISGTLDTFSDRIVNGFEHLIDRLQAIAENVTFKAPNSAYGVMPYKASAMAFGGSQDVGTAIESANDEMASVVTQVVMNATGAIVQAIQTYCGVNVSIDERAIADRTIKEINRRTRATGESPLVS